LKEGTLKFPWFAFGSNCVFKEGANGFLGAAGFTGAVGFGWVGRKGLVLKLAEEKGENGFAMLL
jgi:hypothetical protein